MLLLTSTQSQYQIYMECFNVTRSQYQIHIACLNAITHFLRFFIIVPQNKNANIANFVLAVTLEKNHPDKVYNLEMQFSKNPDI